MLPLHPIDALALAHGLAPRPARSLLSSTHADGRLASQAGRAHAVAAPTAGRPTARPTTAVPCDARPATPMTT